MEGQGGKQLSQQVLGKRVHKEEEVAHASRKRTEDRGARESRPILTVVEECLSDRYREINWLKKGKKTLSS